jgi:hypothetical protein
LVSIGQTIYPQLPHLQEGFGRILSDGRNDVSGRVFDTPSGAGSFVRKMAVNGWSFWLADRKAKISLASIRREYLETVALESDVGDEDLISDDAAPTA